MTTDIREAPITGTKRFMSPAEIWAMPGFLPDQPISPQSYKHLHGWYFFDTDELSCCVLQRGGGLCHRRHKWGWVAEGRDGIITIIGHECAETKFNADSTIAKDIARSQNEINRLREEQRLREMLSMRTSRVAEIDQFLDNLEGLQERMGQYRNEFGAPVWGKVEWLARKQSGRVEVEAFTPAKYDENDDLVSQEVRFRVPIGVLAGIKACDPAAAISTIQALRALRKDYFKEVDSSRTAAINKAMRELAASLAGHERLISNARQLLDEASAFGGNDFKPLCFLLEDKAERYKVARRVLSVAGQELGKDAAKDWLSSIEADLRRRHGVKSIRVCH